MQQKNGSIVQFRLPEEMTQAISEAAARECLTVSAYLRRLAFKDLKRMGIRPERRTA